MEYGKHTTTTKRGKREGEREDGEAGAAANGGGWAEVEWIRRT